MQSAEFRSQVTFYSHPYLDQTTSIIKNHRDVIRQESKVTQDAKRLRDILLHLKQKLRDRAPVLEQAKIETKERMDELLRINERLEDLGKEDAAQRMKDRNYSSKGAYEEEKQTMYHYCLECKQNDHCKKCCPYIYKDIMSRRCKLCNGQGHEASVCCMKGTLGHMEVNFQKKKNKRTIRDEYEKDDYDVPDDDIDPNVILYQQTMEIRRQTEESMYKAIQSRKESSLTVQLGEMLKFSDKQKYDRLLKNLGKLTLQDCIFLYEDVLSKLEMG